MTYLLDPSHLIHLMHPTHPGAMHPYLFLQQSLLTEVVLFLPLDPPMHHCLLLVEVGPFLHLDLPMHHCLLLVVITEELHLIGPLM